MGAREEQETGETGECQSIPTEDVADMAGSRVGLARRRWHIAG